ncbi:hypothetical protein G9A89_001093 [Geosiphon pyriformis]|nr:hypothetical protein G9A89_001093 [Geosiphon pyriformis]
MSKSTSSSEVNATSDQNVPFWGHGTSTLDWCEENYKVHEYFAEFINTTTNLTFVCLALFGIYTTLKYDLGKRFIFAHMGIATIGIGSWFFHMTLLFEFQLLDELPMIYGTCILLYNIYEIHERPKFGFIFPFSLFIYAITITLAYLYIGDPVFHQVACAFLVSALHIRSVLLLQRVENLQTRANLKFLLFGGAGLFALGFFLWNVDNIACTHLIAARNFLGLPLAHFLEFHGWWHILTALGTYWWMVYNQYIRVVLLDKPGKEHEWEVKWFLGFVPQIARTYNKQE